MRVNLNTTIPKSVIIKFYYFVNYICKIVVVTGSVLTECIKIYVHHHEPDDSIQVGASVGAERRRGFQENPDKK